MRLIIAILYAICATPVFAQDFKIDPHLIDRCFPIVDDPMLCVGREAYDCIFRNGGGPNMVLGACYEAEAAVWDDFLNEAYRDLMSLAHDLESSDSGWETGVLVNTLRGMQRSWIVYRDARCANAVALAKPFGSRASAASAFCQMEETARQYFVLRGMRKDYEFH
ncbi:lysozyme inhibitor LprI family protein [Pseudophaeobacter flagellatus]|uniref:lysozyme inhibitor LprI family protein n=1 Tax=Pseudophaeobacter flagellatus TaxID=2899119 RepID=UPI001E3ABD88|nr:lysozyme inhibitor LprI family protein [Pseudophaeobacter flagellatus]MCD9146241.1 DUF1311 domain-containing protein [Pseudophaeobacter flagellatus]